MIKIFNEAVKFLECYIPLPSKKHPGKLGLDRMKLLMRLLGNPQFTYPTIHVGGTSGKGSTSTIVASILATKYKVGLHTSPHLERINERIKILVSGSCRSSIPYKCSKPRFSALDGTPSLASPAFNNYEISDKEFIDLINEIYPAIKRVEESSLGKPSYFEIVAAMAFLYFQKQKVDFAVIEVGMGGRYDATNVIKPQVAVITNVGLDHTEILGDTVKKIAKDKVGIIKPGISVVTGIKQQSVINIISAKCEVQGAKLSLSGKDFHYNIKQLTEEGSVFDYFGIKTSKNLKLPLLGAHQVENASIAIRAIELSKNPITQLPNKEVRIGLSNAFIPGRLEIVRRKPLVILDGAHNPEKMKALVTAMKVIFPDYKITAIIAIKSGKNAAGMLREIIPICRKIIFTKFHLTTDLGDTFSYEPEELMGIISRGPLAISAGSPLIKVNPIKAINDAITEAKTDDVILVTGSLYLVGEVRQFLISND